MRKLTLEQFKNKSKEKHGDKYDYSKVNYINNSTKILIICKKHGEFYQSPDMHMGGRGCQICKKEKLSKINTSSDQYVIEKMKRINGDKYDYSLVEYKHGHQKVKIICKKHNYVFLQSPANHCHPFIGCDLCKKENMHYTLEDFIKKSKEKHGDKYDYSKVNYINSRHIIEIICKKHGSFFQMPVAHMEGKGCKKCRCSRGENKIDEILSSKNIKFIREYKFDKCRSLKNKKLSFDFYLPDYNVCIEFDGEQHFVAKPRWDGQKGLIYTQQHDAIKNNFCKINNIHLYRITYKDDIVDKMEEIITSKLIHTSCNCT